MSFALRPKKAQVDKGLSQTELGSLAGLHYTQIGRCENKGAQPSGDILSKLANALRESSDYLTNGSTDEMVENTLSDKELLSQFGATQKMPDNDKYVVNILIGHSLQKIQQLAI